MPSKSQGHTKRLDGDHFTIEEIWSMSQRSNQQWGVEGYEVPVIHHDAAKIAKDKIYFKERTSGKPKKPGKLNMNLIRGGMFYDIPKRSAKVPAPWKYNLKSKWILGYKNNQRLGDVTPRKLKQSYFKWVDHKPEASDFEKGQPA